MRMSGRATRDVRDTGTDGCGRATRDGRVREPRNREPGTEEPGTEEPGTEPKSITEGFVVGTGNREPIRNQ